MQDTVYVLRRLHVEYLWVDSLCIIQGDDGDWEHEASSMALIYKNATFTISATKSQGSYDSLFSDPTNTATGAHLGTLPLAGDTAIRLEEWLVHPFKVSWLSSDFPRQDDETLRSEGLLGRGWVYQEVLLSPRILFFLDREIMWRCQKYKACQCARYDADRTAWCDLNVVAEEESTGTHYFSLREHRHISTKSWARIIEDYAAKELTYPKDRLPALAGIAEEFGKEKQWTYICGLWQENISDIMWCRDRGQILRARPDILESLPTWSWASMPSKPTFSARPGSVKFRSYHAVYNDKGKNPYLGDVRDAILTVEGNVLRTKVVRRCDANHLVDEGFSWHRESRYGVSIMSKYFFPIVEDCILNESILEEPDVLLLRFTEKYISQPFCLVVYRAEKDSGNYKRLGAADINLKLTEPLDWTEKQMSLV